MRRSLYILVVACLLLPSLGAAASNVSVPDHCTVTDSSGVSHTFASGTYRGICALAAAKAQGAIQSYVLDNFSFGLYLSTLNDVVPSSTQYWDVYQNGAESQVGLSDLTVASGDTLAFQLTDWSSNSKVGAPISFTIGSLVTPVAAVPSGGTGLTLHDPFDVSLATSFLWGAQGANGTFGSSILDDWAAIASAGGHLGDMRERLRAYEVGHSPSLTSTTDYERHAMALEALDIDPYSGTPTNTIAPIVRAFDGSQIGDPALINDDIFALFPLLHAGYTAQDDIISKTLAHIISAQHADGSWDGGVDMTGAALQALSLAPPSPAITRAVDKALGYLRSQQTDDGAFGNPSATAWAIQGIVASGHSGDHWGNNSYLTPEYYLSTQQARDGGVGPVDDNPQKRIWETVYAIPAMEHKSWDMLLSSFPKPVPMPSTTRAQATSTLPAATSTATIERSVPTPSPSPAPAVVVAPATAQTPASTTRPEATSTATDTPSRAQTASAEASTSSLRTLWSVIATFFSHLF